jgi:hypothetical protein
LPDWYVGPFPTGCYVGRVRKLIFVLLAACGSSHSHQTDASSDVAPDVPTTQVQLKLYGAFGPPDFIAYRDGVGGWQTPTGGPKTYTLNVSADYQVVVVCHDTTGSTASELEAMAAEGTQFMQCSDFTGETTPPTTVAMTGHMVQAGQVWLYDTAMSDTGPWDFTLNVAPSVQDLVAVSAAHGMVIRRDVNVTAAGAIPAIDVASEGTAMTPTTLTVNGVVDDHNLWIGTDLTTANASVGWSASGLTVYEAPASLLTSNDSEDLTIDENDIDSTNTGYDRSIFASFPLTGTSFTLPPVPTGIVFGPGKVALGALPRYDLLQFSVSQDRGTSDVQQTVIATKAWIDARHASSLAFDADPPGFDPRWSIDTSQPSGGDLQLYWADGDTEYFTDVFGGSMARRLASRARPSTLERLRASRSRGKSAGS